MAVNDVFSLQFFHTVPNAPQPCSFGLHYRQIFDEAGLSGTALVVDVVAAWVAIAQTSYLLTLPESITLESIYAYSLNNPTDFANVTIDEVGTRSNAGATLVSVRDAPVVNKLTGFRGRSYRGRVRHMPCGEVDNDNGAVSASLRGALSTYYDDAIATQGPSDNLYALTLYSPTLTGDGDIVDTLVNSFQFRANLGTIKGRRKSLT